MKNIYKVGILIILVVIVILVTNIFYYFKTQKDNENYKEICNNKMESYSYCIEPMDDLSKEFVGVINDPKSCYCRMYTHILPRLLVYKVKNNKKELEFIRPSRGIFIIPTLILEKADAFISYGTADNIDFEYSISNLHKKNCYIYNNDNNKQFSKNEYIYFKNNNPKISKFTFEEELKKLKLENKKIYIKINEQVSEIKEIPEIIKHYKNLTGITFMIRLYDSKQIVQFEKLLNDLEDNFVLVSRTELSEKKYCDCDYKNKNLAMVMSLTYINKEYVDEKHMPFKQSYNEKSNYKQLYKLGNYIPKFEVNWILVLSEKIKLLFGKSN